MYFRVSQDGGGFASKSDAIDGFYTNKVESCIVYIFAGTEGVALIHDTAQLSIKSIVDFAKKCGTLKTITYAINSCIIHAEEIKNHAARRKRILNLIPFKGKVQVVDMPLGEVACDLNGHILASFDNRADIHMIAESAVSSPTAPRREMMNTLNNLFIEKNAQNIPIDVQFDHEIIQTEPPLIKTKKQMSMRADLEVRKGDHDYINNLRIADQLGVFKI